MRYPVVAFVVMIVMAASYHAFRGRVAEQWNSLGALPSQGRAASEQMSAPIADRPIELPVLSSSEVEENAPDSFSEAMVNGTRLMPDQASHGRGELEAVNGTDFDACLIVVERDTGHRVRMHFIRAHNVDHLRKLSEGHYKILFATGSNWDRRKEEFLQNGSYYDFGKVLWFSESQEENAVRWVDHTITLHAVPGGDVVPISLSAAAFHSASNMQAQLK